MLSLSALALTLCVISITQYGDHAAMHGRQVQTRDGVVARKIIEVKP